MQKPLLNWVDNTYVATTEWDLKLVSDTTKFIPVTSPATGEIVSYAPLSKREDVDLAVASCKKAFEAWRSRTVKDRIQIMIRLHQLIVKNADHIADLIVLEHGKNRTEALAEIAKGNETLEFALSLPQLMQGHILDVSRGVACRDSLNPLGIVCSIVPFNFPFMVPFWTLPIAITTGNCLVLKPSEKVPMTMTYVMTLMKEAGLPDGVVNLVHGGPETARMLCEHADVNAVTFVGTSAVAELLMKQCRGLNKRVLALGGAKNHLVAYPDCNIDMTAQDVVSSFTGCSGQRCMAASVLLCIGEQPTLIESIVAKATSLTAGQSTGQVGPVIDEASLKRISSYISQAEENGEKILLDGRKWMNKGGSGFWIGPTIILHNNRSDPALHDEIFGPVLSILACDSKEQAIEIENANPYGNAACIYTRDGGVAEWFTKRFGAGMIGVNIGVPVPREPFSFGGINKSSFADSDITGVDALNFFTYKKKVTTKWAPPEEISWLT
ncbi:Aldehyde/histidinol dehydrogenase [Polychytrium aggregatum]|uniref:Aldehyde/histidinol dehydrogenase n=1 Tax=Polychytrium aggregatum TaxID=110093 RepID=UPI0022FE5D42|nr:Aldehyde/histidinol dehydrogenase [Polychytrium aggregatum]KAI9207673.1 Aldehyde/histidinol dehydrogenase [Polychytrium aggregatum]